MPFKKRLAIYKYLPTEVLLLKASILSKQDRKQIPWVVYSKNRVA